jgi:arylsulfatase
MPDKVKQMQALFYSEAAKYNVLPLDNSTLSRWNTERPSLKVGRTVFTYSGELYGVVSSAAPDILNKSYRITAEVEVPDGGGQGMIVTDGGRFGGYAMFLSRSFNWWDNASVFRNIGLLVLLFGLLLVWMGRSRHWKSITMGLSYLVVVLAACLVIAVFTTRIVGLGQGKPVFLYNFLDLKRTAWAGPELSAGKHTIVFDFKSDGPDLGKGGTGVLLVDGREVDRKSIEHGTPVTFPEDESFDIGRDTRTGVALLEYRYDPPFKFNGKIDNVTFDLKPGQSVENDPKQVAAPAGAVARAKD